VGIAVYFQGNFTALLALAEALTAALGGAGYEIIYESS